MPIWFVTKRRAYSIDALTENAETVFDAEVIPLLSSHTILDIQQAGRAVAFEVPTAAGFHAVRATKPLRVVITKSLLASGQMKILH